ncbi:prepilin-type N-terminal cleavage/methylation domain-containing protein [Paenisporosarcina sp. TG-14]|uniref:prepilin-type N-terminal cleavage/methylation domain-containing protein n=1 Tax=Paenisporosarcina sp. TG-14 TaxID=1231057 RepID=UPI000305FA2C|nr:prepilin-type N-terminal cleavage/methylation domain-containing protein [Paenisporosarcina sp. TG-14]
MRKFIQQKLKEQKGLTLIELLAVIVILAIIAAIAIPAIGNIIENSRVGAIKSDGTNTLAAAELYFTENPDDTDDIANTAELAPYIDDLGSFDGETDAVFTSVTRGSASTPATLNATGVVGGVKIVFVSATKESINKIKNSDTGTPASGVTITR